MLGRSAWAGSRRFGGAVWSGDTHSDFKDLNQQFRAGLNMVMSGIPYWTTDIGGYGGGNIDSANFRQLIVRWFQWGAFCPCVPPLLLPRVIAEWIAQWILQADLLRLRAADFSYGMHAHP